MILYCHGVLLVVSFLLSTSTSIISSLLCFLGLLLLLDVLDWVTNTPSSSESLLEEVVVVPPNKPSKKVLPPPPTEEEDSKSWRVVRPVTFSIPVLSALACKTLAQLKQILLLGCSCCCCEATSFVDPRFRFKTVAGAPQLGHSPERV